VADGGGGWREGRVRRVGKEERGAERRRADAELCDKVTPRERSEKMVQNMQASSMASRRREHMKMGLTPLPLAQLRPPITGLRASSGEKVCANLGGRALVGVERRIIGVSTREAFVLFGRTRPFCVSRRTDPHFSFALCV